MKTSKGNMQAITSEGKNDLTKQNCKIKNGQRNEKEKNND